jgi:hypothetical protein
MKNILTASIILFLSSCDGFEKDIDFDFANFPPKLVVTAILDRNDESGESTFTITLNEGRSMADYIDGVLHTRIIKAQGKITLFENDAEIFAHAGEFDMSTKVFDGYWDFDEDKWIEEKINRGYRYERSGFVTHAGRTYRLEVDVDGYPAVTSVAVIPASPAISATADTTALVNANRISGIGSLEGSYGTGDGAEIDFFTVTLHLDKRSSTTSYYALEMLENGNTVNVFVSDLNHFPDNPDVEANNEMAGLFDKSDMDAKTGMFSFPLFLMNDGNFPRENASLHLYGEFYSSANMSLPGDDFEFYTTRHVLSLRVRHITVETFRYYRSMALQNAGMDFFSEPVNIAGNIKNGYGIFSAYNSKEILLLDYKRYWIRRVEPEYLITND